MAGCPACISADVSAGLQRGIGALNDMLDHELRTEIVALLEIMTSFGQTYFHFGPNGIFILVDGVDWFAFASNHK